MVTEFETEVQTWKRINEDTERLIATVPYLEDELKTQGIELQGVLKLDPFNRGITVIYNSNEGYQTLIPKFQQILGVKKSKIVSRSSWECILTTGVYKGVRVSFEVNIGLRRSSRVVYDDIVVSFPRVVRSSSEL